MNGGNVNAGTVLLFIFVNGGTVLLFIFERGDGSFVHTKMNKRTVPVFTCCPRVQNEQKNRPRVHPRVLFMKSK